MTGNFVDGTQKAVFTLGSRLKAMASNPSKHHLNFHSIASWTHWQIEGKDPGLAFFVQVRAADGMS